MSIKVIIDALGWLGGAEVVIGYILISLKITTAENFYYQFLNLTGAFLLIINTWYHQAYPSAIVNIIWVSIAIYTMIYFKKKQKSEGMNENPIDKDKVAENPGLLPYAHTIGSAVIKPEDRGKIKSKALSAMRQQTDKQMSQLYRQMQLIAGQANEIKKRVEISEKIYMSDMGFEPLVGHTYYLYEKDEGKNILSIVSPEEWGPKIPFKKFISKALLLADHTWEIEYSDYTNE